MRPTEFKHWAVRKFAIVCLGVATLLLTLYQVEKADQTLPSPYCAESVQYYPTGPEFKLTRAAAAIQEQEEAIQSQAQNAPGH